MSVLNQSPPTELVDEDEIDGAGRRVGVSRRQASLLSSNIHQDEGQSYLSWLAAKAERSSAGITASSNPIPIMVNHIRILFLLV
jgi:hypothetical protein